MRQALKLLCALVAIGIVGHATANKPIDSKLTSVVVFTDGAQLTRQAECELHQGYQTITISGLSPEMDATSIKLRAMGDFTIIGMESKRDHGSKISDGKRTALIAQRDKLNKEYEGLTIDLEVLTAEEQLLKENCTAKEASVTTARELTNYYIERLNAIKHKRLEVEAKRESTYTSIQHLNADIDDSGGDDKRAMQSVVVRVDANKPCHAEFELSYFVSGAGWIPQYEIHAASLSSPVEIVQRARVFQNTGEAWDNVSLTLSTIRPSAANIAPELQTYNLDYGVSAPRYDNTYTGRISGYVYSNDGPCAGAIVRASDSSIATITDGDGYYSLTIPKQCYSIDVSCLGYPTTTRYINSATMDIYMNKPQRGVGRDMVAMNKARMESYEPMEAEACVTIADAAFMDITVMESPLSFDYHIERSYTIHSDGNAISVDIARHTLDASYYYIAVPKVDNSAFLVAHVPKLSSLDLIPGEASVYFEGCYVGTSILDLEASNDNTISMGRDNTIVVERKKQFDYSKRRALGQGREESVSWLITLRNTRKNSAHVIIYDQIPVSARSEIEVTPDKLSGGALDALTGEVKWDVNLRPGDERKIELEYKVRYPKGKSLIVE